MTSSSTSKFLTIFAISTILISAAPKAFASWLIDSSGELSYQGSVLGDDSEESDEGEDSPNENQEDEKEDQEDESHTEKQDDSSDDSSETEDESESQQQELETARRTPNLKYKLESKDGKLTVKREVQVQDDGTVEEEVEIEDNTLEVDEPTGKFSLKLKSTGDDSQLLIRARNAARTNFPLSISEDNELVVTTPAGTRVVTVLPDQAVANLLAGDHLDRVVSEDSGLQEADELNSEVDNLVSLEEDQTGEPVYVVEGESDQKILGLFDTTLKRRLVVSAQTGELIRTEFDSFLGRVLDLISF